MPIKFLFFLFLGSSLAMTFTTAATADDAPSPEETYKKKSFKSGTEQLLYRFLTPANIVQGKRYPLVLFLHGAGERGRDNTRQLIHGLPEFLTPKNRADFPCFVIAPQCPQNQKWVEVDWSQTEHEMPKEMSKSFKLIWKLLQKISEDYPVDERRIYITGLSMGGYGTWDFIQRKPDYFAAAIPICGGADEHYAGRLTDLPIWAFHGDRDPAVPVIRTTRMIEAIEKAGGKPKMTIYEGVGHNSWS